LRRFVVAGQTSGEWPQWQRANRDGVSKGPGLLNNGLTEATWSGKQRRRRLLFVLITRPPARGIARRSPFVIAFDITNGKFGQHHGRAFAMIRRWASGTPTIDGDRVYALGGSGDLSALDVRNGQIVWTLNVLSEVRRIEYQVGHQRIAAGDRRQSSGERRRSRRFDRGP
jgi:outer membrane protein assembly factor BamB